MLNQKIRIIIVLLACMLLVIPGFAQNITTSNPVHNYPVNDPAITVAPSLIIEGSGTMNSATVSIQSFETGDILGHGLVAGITGLWDPITKTLTFTGSASYADYQTILRTVTFASSTAVESTRQIDFVVGSGVSLIVNGKEHIYEVISHGGDISWTDAYAAARLSSYDTLRGYLATITNDTENSFLASKLINNTWIGATDQATEGAWIWADGPETGVQFWSGLAAPSGGPVSGRYNNWSSGEPNNAGGENYAHFWAAGDWNDYANTNSVQYYIIEYGGFPSSPISLGTSDNAFVNVLVSNLPPIANDDFYYVYTNTTRTIDAPGVLGNDNDPNGDTPTVNPTDGVFASNGIVTIKSTGEFSYTPSLTYIGIDSFQYRCFDGSAVDVGTCELEMIMPIYTGTGYYNEGVNWNGGYVPPYIDGDMDIEVSGTLTTDGEINVNNLTINGTINVAHSIIVENLSVHSNATMNFSNGATITVNNAISNESRTSIQLSSPVVFHSGIKIN